MQAHFQLLKRVPSIKPKAEVNLKYMSAILKNLQDFITLLDGLI